MNDTELRNYAAVMKEMGITSLEITEGNLKVRMERQVSGSVQQAGAMPGMTSEERILPEKEIPAVSGNEAEADASAVVVRSPLVGMFYAAPAENADPYVAVGDPVQKGQVLCVVEAMKLMNEITAEIDGVIEAICAANGHMVEYGTPLFKIRRA